MHELRRQQGEEQLDSARWDRVEIDEERPDGTKRRAIFRGRLAISSMVLIAGIVAICQLASKDGPWYAHVLVATVAVLGVVAMESRAHGTSEKNCEKDRTEP